MIITELRTDDGKSIYEGESYEYKFKDNNPVLRKEFRISSKWCKINIMEEILWKLFFRFHLEQKLIKII